MLEGLDQIDWASLHHAYGSAEDVPELVRDLASDDPDRRYDAYDTLLTNLWHSYTVYEASAYAAPFLIELAQSESVQNRDRVLILLSDLAMGMLLLISVDEQMSHLHVSPNNTEVRQNLVQQLHWARVTHHAVAEGLPVFLKLVRDPDGGVGACAGYLTSCFPERSEELIPGLANSLFETLSHPSKASAILCLGRMAPGDPRILRSLEEQWQSRSSGLIRLAAALALARCWRDTAPEKSAEILDAAMQDPGWDTSGFYPWSSMIFSFDDGQKPEFAAVYPRLSKYDLHEQWAPEKESFVYDYLCGPSLDFAKGGAAP